MTVDEIRDKVLALEQRAERVDENGPPVNDASVDKAALLTELEGLNERQAVIIAALRGVM